MPPAHSLSFAFLLLVATNSNSASSGQLDRFEDVHMPEIIQRDRFSWMFALAFLGIRLLVLCAECAAAKVTSV